MKQITLPRHIKRRRIQREILAITTIVLLAYCVGNASIAQGQAPYLSYVSPSVKPEIFEESLRSLPSAKPWQSGEAIVESPPGITLGAGTLKPDTDVGPTESKDAALQEESASGATTTPPQFLNPSRNFPGINFTGFVPPDPVGDVGPNHYIQMVNVQFQIFDKQGNCLLTDPSGNCAPRAINSLWSNLPAGVQPNCRTNNNGDPIVLYDHLADRWLLSQFAIPNGFGTPPTFQCIAISRGPDPVNDGYHLYEFQFNFAHDYPKLGVWPDGYYMSSQQGFPGGNLNVVVFDRANMLNGNPATFQSRQVAGPAFTFLPADLDGPPPPFGTPNYFARHIDSNYRNVGGSDRVEIWEFRVNWADPASTSFTQTATLNVIPFESDLCGGTPPSLFEICIPQPGLAAVDPNPVNLAAITVWPMWRLQYRNFGTHDTLVFNHTVNADPGGNDRAGNRWYEIRTNNPGSGNWFIYQQGTYAPQEDPAIRSQPEHRWMGSVAMDRAGNMALGYSVSSLNLRANGDDVDGYPSVRYTGRRANEPLGLMPQTEVTLIQGTGPQLIFTGTPPMRSPRWGDYSSMNIDPVDNCTFWYTNEYVDANGVWRTRIGAFRFPSCNPVDLAIFKTANRVVVPPGEDLFYTLTVRNNSPDNATDVVVTDTLPAGVTFIVATDTCVESPPGTLTCDLGDLAAGKTVSFVIKVLVDAYIRDSTTITNIATVTSDQQDPDQTNNTAKVTTIVEKREVRR